MTLAPNLARLAGAVASALSIAALSAGMANAACASFSASNIQVTYDPLGTNAQFALTAPFTMMATSVSSAHQPDTKSLTAQLVDINPSVGGLHRVGNGGPLFHILSSGTDVVVSASDPIMPANVFTVIFPSTGSSSGLASLQFWIDANQDVPAGAYSTALDVRYLCHNDSHDSNANQTQPGVLPITVMVPSSVRATLAGGSTTGSIDFGDFSELSKSVNVNVRSTGPFTIAATSDNGGVMKMKADGTGASGANTRIPYSVTLDGQAFTLGGPGQRFGRTGLGGTSIPLSVQIQSVQANRSGIYNDHIVLTITPLGA